MAWPAASTARTATGFGVCVQFVDRSAHTKTSMHYCSGNLHCAHCDLIHVDTRSRMHACSGNLKGNTKGERRRPNDVL